MVPVFEEVGSSGHPEDRTSRKKIKDLTALAELLAARKATGDTIVHCHGVFDLVHPGHIRHLAEARRLGQVLVVTITADRFIKKGPNRPAFNHNLRAETLAALVDVDFVAICDFPTAIEAIAAIRPNVYVKGSEYARPENDITGKILEEADAVHKIGGRIHYTNDITFSSSQLINSHFSLFPQETQDWLVDFRKKYSNTDILNYLNNVNDLKVLVVGEAIIDDYVFCLGLGKSAKDPILAFQYQFMETYAGGSLAVANHLSGFCREVGLVALLGETERREEFVRNSLHPQIEFHPVTQLGAPTLHKRRFVDTHTGAKMFELYVMDDSPLQSATEAALLAQLEALLPRYDVVIVPDYGHGMMTPAAIELLCSKAHFLVVNTQANAGNRGFNTISKYRRADYVCLAGHEMQLETRNRHGSFRTMLMEMASRIDCPGFTVTMGRHGSLHYVYGGDIIDAPALATKVVDRVGAGDGVLAVTSLLVAQNAPWEIVAFITNVAGAEMVGDLGNRRTLDRTVLSKHVIGLMK